MDTEEVVMKSTRMIFAQYLSPWGLSPGMSQRVGESWPDGSTHDDNPLQFEMSELLPPTSLSNLKP